MSKPVRFVAGEGLQAAISIIRKAKASGISVPDLAEKMEVGQSTADNYARRLFSEGLVTKHDGETPGQVGRPPVIWVWAGKDVELVTPEDVKAGQHAEAEARKAAARAERLTDRAEIIRAEAGKHTAAVDKAKAKLPKAKTHQERTHLEAVIRKGLERVKALTTRAANMERMAKGGSPKVAKPTKPQAEPPRVRKGKARAAAQASKAASKPAAKPARKGLTEAQRAAKNAADKARRAKGKPAVGEPGSTALVSAPEAAEPAAPEAPPPA